jgi:putative spermidine/putrescine transport system ATP-binding protein
MNGGRIAQLGTPDELYFEPVNEFVADFVGESNLLEGVVQGDNAVRLIDGTTLRVRSTEGHAAGSAVKVLVRPEKISVVEDNEVSIDANSNVYRGAIAQTSFIGGMTRFELQLSTGATLLVKTISARAAERAPFGHALTMRWSARDSVVLKK